VPTLAPSASADLVNVATPGQPSGDCPTTCSTTHETPPVTTLVVQKVDLETGEALAGATFGLYLDNAPYADSPAVVGTEDLLLGEWTSGLDGLASVDGTNAGPPEGIHDAQPYRGRRVARAAVLALSTTVPAPPSSAAPSILPTVMPM